MSNILPTTDTIPSATATATLNPNDLRDFGVAVAGHKGVLSDQSGSLLIKPCTQKEVDFYQESILYHKEFAKLMPTFFGTLKLGHTAPEEEAPHPAHPSTSSPEVNATSATTAKAKPNDRNASIVLSNSTYGFKKPCVLDLKLGARLWDDDASEDKRVRFDAVARSTTSGTLGLRIAGMKVYKAEDDDDDDDYDDRSGYAVYGKLYGRKFTSENVIDGLKAYLSAPLDLPQKIQIVKGFLNVIGQIKNILENQESRMYAASLLFVYEGDRDALERALAVSGEGFRDETQVGEEEEEDEDEDEDEGGDGDGDDEDDEDEDEDEDEGEEDRGGKKAFELKIIDFAHAKWTPGQGPDRNLLQGVENTQRLFVQLAGEFEKEELGKETQ